MKYPQRALCASMLVHPTQSFFNSATREILLQQNPESCHYSAYNVPVSFRVKAKTVTTAYKALPSPSPLPSLSTRLLLHCSAASSLLAVSVGAQGHMQALRPLSFNLEPCSHRHPCNSFLQLYLCWKCHLFNKTYLDHAVSICNSLLF